MEGKKQKENLCKLLGKKVEEFENTSAFELSEKKDEVLLALLQEEISLEEQCKAICIERLQAYIQAWESEEEIGSQNGFDIGCKLVEKENEQGFWINNKQKVQLEILKFEIQNTEFFQKIKKILSENQFSSTDPLESHKNYMAMGIAQVFIDQVEKQGFDVEALSIEEVKKGVNELAGKSIFLFEEDILRQKINELEKKIALLEEKEKELLAGIRVRKKELYSLEEKKKEKPPFVKKEGKNSPHEQNKKKKNRGNKKKA